MKFIEGVWDGGGVGVGDGVGVGGGRGAEGGQYHPQGDKQQCCVFSIAQKLPQSLNLVGRDGHQQQFDTPSSLISAHQWPVVDQCIPVGFSGKVYCEACCMWRHEKVGRHVFSS